LYFELEGFELFFEVVLFLHHFEDFAFFFFEVLPEDAVHFIQFLLVCFHDGRDFGLVLVPESHVSPFFLLASATQHLNFIFEKLLVAALECLVLLLNPFHFGVAVEGDLLELGVQLRVFGLQVVRLVDVVGQLVSQ
jgi:hypothetical protein